MCSVGHRRIASLPISLNCETNRIGFLWKSVMPLHTSKHADCLCAILYFSTWKTEFYLDKLELY
jgi:hypothetical protein